jgi:GDP-4-dehydro-6-deoxy-D-mannose reductase
MRILVTGATGFVGRWLVRELEAAGHETIPAPGSSELDITDAAAVADLVGRVRPEGIAHLAGVSYAGDAARDPARALAVNEGGTRAVIEAAAPVAPVAVLVVSSSEVYGRPDPDSLPLGEGAPLRADQPYGLSKLAQERAARQLGDELGVRVVVARSFNHTGPGQRPDFVAPALARRVLAARASGSGDVVVGNIDVRRDLGDVRDVVRAYRLLLEGLARRSVVRGTVVNVATGRSVSIRWVLETLAAAAGITVTPRVDPALVRANDPPEIRGDSSLLHRLTGWESVISLETTLADLMSWVESQSDGAPPSR